MSGDLEVGHRCTKVVDGVDLDGELFAGHDTARGDVGDHGDRSTRLGQGLPGRLGSSLVVEKGAADRGVGIGQPRNHEPARGPVFEPAQPIDLGAHEVGLEVLAGPAPAGEVGESGAGEATT